MRKKLKIRISKAWLSKFALNHKSPPTKLRERFSDFIKRNPEYQQASYNLFYYTNRLGEIFLAFKHKEKNLIVTVFSSQGGHGVKGAWFCA